MDNNVKSNQPAEQLTYELKVAFHRNPQTAFNQGQLEEMYHANRGYMRECVRVMFSLAVSKVQLQVIDLPNERLSEDGALYLWLLMQYFTRLSLLRLMDNALGTTGLRYLISGFKTANRIEILDLGMNHLVDDSMTVLAEGLALLPLLQQLKLNNNEIADHGASVLSEVLLTRRELVVLDMSFNDIADGGCVALFHNMPNSIQRISVIANHIGHDATPSIRLSLSRLPHLQELNLGGNRFQVSDRRVLKTGRYEKVVHFGIGKSLCVVM